MFRLLSFWIAALFVLSSCGSSREVPKENETVESETPSTNDSDDGTAEDNSADNAPSSDTGNTDTDGSDVTETNIIQAGKIFSLDGVAIRGTDPVGYFNDAENAPIAGNSSFSLSWAGATWHFVSEENRDLFKAEPLKYAPQFGGYCSYAASVGAMAQTVPEAWDVIDGKLYLNASLSIRDLWRQNTDENIRKGNENWPSIIE